MVGTGRNEWDRNATVSLRPGATRWRQQGFKVLVIKEADYKAMQKTTAPIKADWIKQAAEVHAIGNQYLNK